MDFQKYSELKNELEKYFANVIKERFRELIEENFDFTITADYLTHRAIENVLKNDGLDVYGMNVNMDGFQLLLDFDSEYLTINNFPFTRLVVEFSNDGNYSVFLDEDNLSEEWTVNLEDHYRRYLNTSEADFLTTLKEIEQTHLVIRLKS
jgi:hypothetical protein